MRRSLLLLLLLGSTCFAQDAFTVDGRSVTVRTDRYVITFDGPVLVRLENRLTGETYARPPAGQWQPGEAGQAIQGRSGIAIESLRPAVPVRYYGAAEQTQVTAEKTDEGARIVLRGLQHEDEFDPGLAFTVRLSVDAKTGDLLIRPEAQARIEEVFGVRDRGVLRAAVQMRHLAESLRMIVPASDGFSVTKDDMPAEWRAGWRWPQFWEAALLIGESEKGCFGIWADEPELNYGRHLGLARSAGAWHAVLEFETNKAIYRCTDLTGAIWRLNVFDGYWVKAARRYRDQMEAQWDDLKRLDENTPAWAEKVRIVLGNHIPHQEAVNAYAALVPQDTMILFTSQGWLKGWNDGQIQKLGHGMDYFPNWPLQNPDHYEAAEGVPEALARIEAAGVHTFPYTNSTICTHRHPWLRKKLGQRHIPLWRIWQRLYPELCLDVVNRYKVTGIYEDCSWVLNRHKAGEPDGDNWYNGSARMRRYFRKLMPETAVMGERNNEVTCRGQHFALTITQWGGHAHPINAFLFGPFLRMWNLQLQPRGFDADDIRGYMTPWPSGYEANPIQERLMIRKRGIVFAREQLESRWPERWEPAVMHYLKSKDGTDYRFVRDRGTKFIKLIDDAEEVIYWRLHGVRDAVVRDVGVEGWLGYDGERIVGLNPRAVYIVMDDVKRPEVAVSQVPEDVAIKRCLVRDGFWLATFAPIREGKRKRGQEEKEKARQCTIRVRSTGPAVSFTGAKTVKQVGDREYELQLTVPGGLGAYWRKPDELFPGSRLSQLPARNTVHRRDSGLVSHYGRRFHEQATIHQRSGSVDSNEEGSILWLVRVPEIGGNEQVLKRSYLVFTYGSGHPFGDGANYKVRINGREVWKRYRPEMGPPDPDRPGQRESRPLDVGAVNLEQWAGQVVILELAVDGNRTNVSESIKWHNPAIRPDAPKNAEMDEAAGPPEAPGADPLMERGLME